MGGYASKCEKKSKSLHPTGYGQQLHQGNTLDLEERFEGKFVCNSFFLPQAEVLLTVCEALMEFVTVHGADRDVRTAEQLIGRNIMIERGFP
jgi:hypothetical protein